MSIRRTASRHSAPFLSASSCVRRACSPANLLFRGEGKPETDVVAIDVDSEGYEIIHEVKKYFQNMEISKELAQEIEMLYLDGGNKIYLQLCPFWDGEDDLFTIKSISEEELKQFTNLRKTGRTLLKESKKIKDLLKKYNIEIVD